jgi:CRISPR system Cascade subunit CasD
MATSSVLALRLEAPLQAWGDSARWSVRDTRTEPTFSGIVGLVAAAWGWGLTDEDGERVAALSRSVRLGVRVDREGTVLRDYHTIGGTRSGSETPWTGLLTAEGKTKRTATTAVLHTEVSERNYLCDACFLVMLEADGLVLAGIEAALQAPVWPPFLGRKACVPAAPLCPAHPQAPSIVSGPLVDAIASYPGLGRSADTPPEQLRVVVDEACGAAAGMRSLRHDVPKSFRRRLFGHRYVREFRVTTPSSCGEV